MIHLWSPGLFEFKGGIQTFSRYLCESFADVLPDQPQQVFSLHDKRAPQSSELPENQHYTCYGKMPAKARIPYFAASLVAKGLINKPNLIVSTHLNLAVVACYLKRVANIPYWVVAHGFEAWDIQKPSVKNALINADKVLAVSHYTRQQLIDKYPVNPDRISVFPNTFDSARFKVSDKPQHLLEKYQLSKEQPVILTVNRLEAGESFKPYDQVIQALPQIKVQIPDVRYLIVGKGNDRDRLEHYIQDQQLEDTVTLAGFVPDEDLSDHYSLCDLYAMPSKLEGFGIVYLEALASGRPVIASSMDGGADALCNGKLGALVNPESIDEIAETAIRILQKTYSNPLIYSPNELRQNAIATFGREQFNRNLSAELEQFDFHKKTAANLSLIESP